jgi:hypothetical protein
MISKASGKKLAIPQSGHKPPTAAIAAKDDNNIPFPRQHRSAYNILQSQATGRQMKTRGSTPSQPALL